MRPAAPSPMGGMPVAGEMCRPGIYPERRADRRVRPLCCRERMRPAGATPVVVRAMSTCGRTGGAHREVCYTNLHSRNLCESYVKPETPNLALWMLSRPRVP